VRTAKKDLLLIWSVVQLGTESPLHHSKKGDACSIILHKKREEGNEDIYSFKETRRSEMRDYGKPHRT